jgi:hypothetical protein
MCISGGAGTPLRGGSFLACPEDNNHLFFQILYLRGKVVGLEKIFPLSNTVFGSRQSTLWTGMIVHASNPGTQEDVAGGSQL